MKDSISTKLKFFAESTDKNAADKKDISITRKDRSKFRIGRDQFTVMFIDNVGTITTNIISSNNNDDL